MIQADDLRRRSQHSLIASCFTRSTQPSLRPFKGTTSFYLGLKTPSTLNPRSTRQPSWPRFRAASSPARAWGSSGSGGWRWHGQRRPGAGRGGSRSWRSCWRQPCRCCLEAKEALGQAPRAPGQGFVSCRLPRMVPLPMICLPPGALATVMGDAGKLAGGLVGRVGLLGGDNDATLLNSLDTDGLRVCKNICMVSDWFLISLDRRPRGVESRCRRPRRREKGGIYVGR